MTFTSLVAQLPPEFDSSSYIRRYKDLQARSFSSEQLLNHWLAHGFREGRCGSTFSKKRHLLQSLSECNELLEIGVFDRPILRSSFPGKSGIHHADWLDADSLKARASLLPGRNPKTVPIIDWVLSKGFSQIDLKYEAVFSNHCVEHQPCLVSHLVEVTSLLKPGGAYFFAMPDKDRCFDHFIPCSTIADVLAAYYEKRRAPSFKSVLEHRCFISKEWKSTPNPYDSLDPDRLEKFSAAFDEYTKETYVDVHCWQFTPYSFKRICEQLIAYDLMPNPSDFKVYSFDDFEFAAALVY